jgi:hypothetical protein
VCMKSVINHEISNLTCFIQLRNLVCHFEETIHIEDV